MRMLMEIADRLAKEAEQNQLDSHNTITKQDVKKSSKGPHYRKMAKQMEFQ